MQATLVGTGRQHHFIVYMLSAFADRASSEPPCAAGHTFSLCLHLLRLLDVLLPAGGPLQPERHAVLGISI